MISMVSKKKDYDQHDSSNKLIYSYTKVFNAFAATLDEEEAKELARIAEVLASSNTTVNIKPSPRDMMGHGSHTLSTAGGNVVPVLRNDAFCFEALDINNVSVKGGSPRSRVVSYKAVWPELKISKAIACYMDSLAAMEAAIGDGVDVINLSLGAVYSLNDLKAPGDYYFQDPYSITSFHAMVNGIVIVTSVGNDGPKPPVVGNPAPWVLTVAAGTIDREFTCNIILGNDQKIKAARYFDPPSNDTFYPLISGGDARIIGADLTNASYCFPETLDPVKVNGKILVCTVEQGDLNMPYLTIEATKIGAIGVIATNNEILGSTLFPDSNQMLPTAHITYKDAQTLFSYINSTRTPTAKLTQTRTIVQTKPAPVVAEFSSKGPNTITPEILKPDVLAPGVSIIAAWSQDPNATMSGAYFPHSGTSMAAPHVAGIAALLRKLYPHWTPSAIKSAIITTATPLDNSGMRMHEDDMVHEATPFGFGAGLVQPNQAMDPGLVYDMTVNDYIDFLCAHHFNNTVLELFTKQYAYKCPQSVNILNLNYPSITIPNFSGSASVTRKLKNVAQPATYKARIKAPPGISIIVKPNTLVYSKPNQEKKFKLIFSSDVNHLPLDYQFGSLVWSDGKHIVRSPIVIKAKPRTTPLKH
ncbi:hypothetical protein BVRB_4g091050 [Beta vulgaris subsp. vulgaris]|uniref:Uncharacterized protein n=1 Tax=Beta vulgaris subsp. vulgaris TaxID=3555 RepID=A0A0J8F9U6_BETVV|nr:hypothetical protein BVRB_4g091050 [Beta vulgaris subsp. vulgaris]